MLEPIIYATSPIILNISGNTTNINPVPDVAICSIPSPVFSDINPSMLNTPIAVIISKLCNLMQQQLKHYLLDDHYYQDNLHM